MTSYKQGNPFWHCCDGKGSWLVNEGGSLWMAIVYFCEQAHVKLECGLRVNLHVKACFNWRLSPMQISVVIKFSMTCDTVCRLGVRFLVMKNLCVLYCHIHTTPSSHTVTVMLLSTAECTKGLHSH